MNERKKGAVMRKFNNDVNRKPVMIDNEGNTLECVGSEKNRARRLNRILGAYCRQIRPAVTENQ